MPRATGQLEVARLCVASSPFATHAAPPPAPPARALLEGECADADTFPPGSLFISEDFSTVGQLTSLACADAAAAEPQPADAALCRVESSSQLARVASSSQIEAN